MQIPVVKDLVTYHDLLFAWTARTVRGRYQQSILGGLWAIAQPIASVIILTVIFTQIVPVDTGDVPYVVFSFSAMVPWLLFSSSLADMTDSLVVNMNLIAKIFFPRDVLVVAVMLARLLDFFIAFTVLLIMMLILQMPLLSWSLLWLPVILAVQLTLALGLGLAGAAMNLFFRDIKHIIALGLQIWFYATPIIYPVTLVPEWARPLYFLNPMAGVIVAYRSVLLENQSPDSYLALSAVVALLVLVVGYLFFKRMEPRFADVV